MFKSLTPTLSIIAAIVLYFFFISPQITEIKNVNAQIGTYKATIEQYEDYNTTVQALKDAKNSINIADVQRLEQMIPSSIDTTRTLVDLEAMAQKHGLLFGNVATEMLDGIAEPEEGEAEVSGGDLVVNGISFEVIGTYEQFKMFLAEMESSLELMEVTEMSLLAATDTFQQYSIVIQTYALSNI